MILSRSVRSTFDSHPRPSQRCSTHGFSRNRNRLRRFQSGPICVSFLLMGSPQLQPNMRFSFFLVFDCVFENLESIDADVRVEEFSFFKFNLIEKTFF